MYAYVVVGYGNLTGTCWVFGREEDADAWAKTLEGPDHHLTVYTRYIDEEDR